jgi:hypothetical protein
MSRASRAMTVEKGQEHRPSRPALVLSGSRRTAAQEVSNAGKQGLRAG